MTKKLPKVWKLAASIRQRSIFEDRLEYSVSDLQLAYELDRTEAEQLQLLLHYEDPLFTYF
jgi:hypothetical protein